MSDKGHPPQQPDPQDSKVADLERELEMLAFSISHDLRAPLRHIEAFAGLLSQRPIIQTDDEARKYLDRIVTSVQRTSAMLEALLAYSRAGRAELHLECVKLERVVHEARQQLEGQMAGREIEWRIEPLPEALADAALLRLAIGHLLANALKFSSERPRAVIDVSVQAGAGVLELCVRDNGVGFDMRYADRLFGLFQRLHPADQFEGAGVGLAVVRRVASRLGGRVWAEGVPGEGAAFHLTLPRPHLT